MDSQSLRPDGRRVAIHTLDVRGRFIRARRIVFALLIALYVAAPLVPIGGHPAIHLDVARRRFFLFGATFNAQDFWIVALLAAALLFTLLFITAWRGRAWCGWACPQTVFLEAVYRPIERLLDGQRTRRLRQALAPFTAARIPRLVLKHALYLGASLVISHAALSLFLSASELVGMVREGPGEHPVAFAWSVAMTGLLYFNFAWFREQFCVVLCPYGRMQSVLHDRNSIVIGYDTARGEPRGRLERANARLAQLVAGDGAATPAPLVATPPPEAAPGPSSTRKGDCIDCKKCIWACPTGIDIRNGLQMECLACAQCIDVCDDVMDKIHRPRGLIRYASLNELAGKATRVWRPRLLVYLVAAILATGGAVTALAARSPFEAVVVRQPGVPWVVDAGTVRNQLEIHLTSKHGAPARFHLDVAGAAGADIRLGQNDVELPAMGDTRVPLVITVPAKLARPGLTFVLTASDPSTNTTQRQDIRFLAPFGGPHP